MFLFIFYSLFIFVSIFVKKKEIQLVGGDYVAKHFNSGTKASDLMMLHSRYLAASLVTTGATKISGDYATFQSMNLLH